MSSFDDAMNMLSMETPATKEGEKKVISNNTHFVNLLARVYSKVAAIHDAKKSYNYDDDVEKIINENNLFSIYAKNGKIADCDVVSIIEAVRWSLSYLTTGHSFSLVPVLVQDTSMPKESNKDLNLFNAFVCNIEGCVGPGYYAEYSWFKKGAVLEILNVAPEGIKAEFISERQV